MLQQLTIQNFNDMLGRFTTAELENLLARTPYFQQAHVLLAKKYQLEHNPKFDEQLQLAALYTNDRELFYTIFNQAVPIVKANVKPIEEQQMEQHTVEPITELPNETSVVEIIQESITIPAVLDETETAAIDNIVVEENLEEPTDTEQVTDLEEEAKAISFTSPHTFDEWISVFKKNKQQAKEEEPKLNIVLSEPEPVEQEPELLDDELDKMIMTNVSSNYLHELVEEEKHYSKGLDVFIADQIRRKRGGETRNAGSETEISADIVTETLAKLYENQKKYGKAIKAYEVLSLKFPEKNGLFAARINYLKKLI